MAPETSSASTADAPLDSVSPSSGKLQAFLLPNIADWVFVAVLGWLFFGAAGAQALLGDGDTGWHIRTGEYFLTNGHLPPTDPFSFTMEGREWFAWEWLADVALALAFQIDGLQGVVLLAAACIGLSAALMIRYMIWSGVNLFLAILGMFMICGVTTSHWLARPHMFTWIFFLATLWLLEADRRSNSRRIWLLVPLVIVWVNTHGGFMALLLSVGVFGFGVALEQLWAEWKERGSEFRFSIPPGAWRYGVVFAACAAATLVNPYGYHLHEHIGEYLQSDFILNAVDEFQAPDFRSEATKIFEVNLLAGLLVAGLMLRRGEFAWPLLMLAWAHATLTSFRHGALFMLAATPVLMLEGTRWIEQGARAGNWILQTFKNIADDYGPNSDKPSESGGLVVSWAPIAMLVFLAYSMNVRGAVQETWRAEFPDVRFPAAALEALGEDRLTQGRVLTSDQWGDYLVFSMYPKYKTFIDGRSDFYDPSVLDDYVGILGSHYSWERTLDKYEFNAVLAPLDWSITAALKAHPGWTLIYDDGFALYFERTEPLGEIASNRPQKEELGAADGDRAALEDSPQSQGRALRSP